MYVFSHYQPFSFHIIVLFFALVQYSWWQTLSPSPNQYIFLSIHLWWCYSCLYPFSLLLFFFLVFFSGWFWFCKRAFSGWEDIFVLRYSWVHPSRDHSEPGPWLCCWLLVTWCSNLWATCGQVIKFTHVIYTCGNSDLFIYFWLLFSFYQII